MIILTSETAPGYEVTRVLGLVRGNTIRTRHLGRDITAGLRGLVGGEISEYTKLFAEAREQALDRMVYEAKTLGADGVIGVRFSTSMVMASAAELLVYGTAVKLHARP